MNQHIVLLQQVKDRFFDKGKPELIEIFNKRLQKEILLNFISTIRSTYPKSSIMFTRGGCYMFHLLLKSVIGDSAIPYSTVDNEKIDHVVTKIGDFYYDISGIWEKEIHYEAMNDYAINIAKTFFENFNTSVLNS